MRDDTNGDDPDHERRPVFEGLTGPEGRRVVRVLGALDLATSDAVESALRSALDDGAAVRLDLSQVTFLDSSGMRGVLRAYRIAQERGAVFEVVPGPPAVQRVLHITGVDARLTFVDADDPRV
jgi:anti-anti-sigma factor